MNGLLGRRYGRSPPNLPFHYLIYGSPKRASARGTGEMASADPLQRRPQHRSSVSRCRNARRSEAHSGFKIADDLVLTRKRTFYKIVGPTAIPVSVQDVSANYTLESLRSSYRKATELWKSALRSQRKRTAS